MITTETVIEKPEIEIPPPEPIPPVPPQPEPEKEILPEHRSNLEALRDYLLQPDIGQFSMRAWCYCAAGHAMNLFDRDTNEKSTEDHVEELFGVEKDSEDFMFLFGGHWADIDNTPGGAADRIDAYLRRA